ALRSIATASVPHAPAVGVLNRPGSRGSRSRLFLKELEVNSHNVLHQPNTQPRSKVTHITTQPSGNIAIPPYFCWTSKWQTSTTELWGSYIKSSSLLVVLRVLRSLQLWTLRSLETNNSSPKG